MADFCNSFDDLFDFMTQDGPGHVVFCYSYEDLIDFAVKNVTGRLFFATVPRI